MSMGIPRISVRIVIVLLFFSCLFPGCTVKNTPRQSLSELRTALLNHDADTALRYIDVDSIVDRMMGDIFLKYEAKSEDPLKATGMRAGREAAKVLLPGLKELLRRQVRTAITSSDESGYFQYIRRASVWYLNITVEGDTAMVEPKGKSDVKFRMAQMPEGYWKIVEIIRK